MLPRHLALGMLGVAQLALLGCDGDDGWPYIDRVETRKGGTCGEFPTADRAPPVDYLRISCGTGLECSLAIRFMDRFDVDHRYGQCIPSDELACGPSHACPVDLLCEAPTSSRCVPPCATDQDCHDGYQVCINGGCDFSECPQPGTTAECVAGRHCEISLCVADPTDG